MIIPSPDATVLSLKCEEWSELFLQIKPVEGTAVAALGEAVQLLKWCSAYLGDRPDGRLSPPGDTIGDLMEEREWSVEDLAGRMNVSPWKVRYLLTGQMLLNPDLAARLEEVFGAPAAFWLKREETYRATMEEL